MKSENKKISQVRSRFREQECDNEGWSWLHIKKKPTI